jgi:hypothetical protein
MADQQQLDELLEWFKSNGGELDEAVELKFNREFGCHFLSTRELKPNTTACTCPFNLTLSHLNCLPSPPEGVRPEAESSVCSSLVGKVAHSAVAAFFLAEQRLKGKDSFWHPYINSLPKEPDMTTPLWFQPQDLMWLNGTNLYPSAVPPHRTAVGLRTAMYEETWKSGVAVLRENGVDVTPYTW